jgi:ABC-2 type transport system permease protein
MITLVNIELYKIFRKWRTYIGFITIAALVLLVELAMLVEGENYFNFLTRNIRDSFLLVGNFLNGYLIAHLLLGALTIHIPFLITLVAADLLAGEATSGTYRMLITRPVSRAKLLVSKFIAGVIYTHSLILFLALVSLGVGVLLFGVGELLVLRDKIIILERSDIIWRFIIAYGFAALSMTVVTALAFFFSSLVENAIGPIIATMAVIIVFLILSSLNFGFLENIRPFLFTNYMQEWRDVFDDPADTSGLLTAGSVLFGHILLFFGITFFLFKKKDITT